MVETICPNVIKPEEKMLFYKEAEFFLCDKICWSIWPDYLEKSATLPTTSPYVHGNFSWRKNITEILTWILFINYVLYVLYTF
jgi:hypothetical protein